MAIIKVKHKGSFKHTENFFNKALKRDYMTVLNRYGRQGVELLREATPKDSGVTSESWDYRIEEANGSVSLNWVNKNENEGVNIAILIIYGHGLANGGYVQANDFVSPTLKPLLEEIANKVWKEVTK